MAWPHPLAGIAPSNRLLAALPPASLARLGPMMECVVLQCRDVLHRPEQPIDTVYFPERGWVSLLALLEDGDAAEVGLVGSEGVVGLPVLLGGACDDLEAIVQAPGLALSLDAGVLREAMEDDPALRRLMLRYALVLHGQVARTAACNVRHGIGERLARWLLMAHDRAGTDSFPVTHEFLSMMLGVRRAGVTTAAGLLQKAQLISYERGSIRVLDRDGLENAACECYGIQRRAFARLPGGTPPPHRR